MSAVTRVWGPSPSQSGPIHAVNAGGSDSQAWCGARPQFRHRHRDGGADDVTCARCRAAIKRGHPFARGRWAK